MSDSGQWQVGDIMITAQTKFHHIWSQRYISLMTFDNPPNEINF